MAQLYVGIGNSTNSWGGGSYNGAGLVQEFTMPYDAAKLNPADGKFYADVQYISTYLSGYQTYALATYRNWFIASTSQRNFVLAPTGAGYRSANNTVSGTTSVERKLAITVGPIGYTTAPVYAMGFQITSGNYWNQYYDATGSTSASADMYYVSTSNVATNTNSAVAKWGGAANWEAAANLAARCYYNTLPTAPAAPIPGTASSTQITISVSVPSDDGAGNGAAGTDITAFRVRYSSNGGTSWSTQDFTKTATTQNVTVTGLSPNTNYIFQVAAINSVATQIGTTASGPYSASSTTKATLADIPYINANSYTQVGYVGEAYSSTPTVSQSQGGGAASISISSYAYTGTLPPGFSFNTSTGAITATTITRDSSVSYPKTYSVTVTCTNSQSGVSAGQSQSIRIDPARPKVYNGTSFVRRYARTATSTLATTSTLMGYYDMAGDFFSWWRAWYAVPKTISFYDVLGGNITVDGLTGVIIGYDEAALLIYVDFYGTGYVPSGGQITTYLNQKLMVPTHQYVWNPSKNGGAGGWDSGT